MSHRIKECEYEVKYRGLRDNATLHAYFALCPTCESKEIIHSVVRARFPLSWMVAARLARPRVRHDFIFVASNATCVFREQLLRILRMESFLSPESGGRGEESPR